MFKSVFEAFPLDKDSQENKPEDDEIETEEEDEECLTPRFCNYSQVKCQISSQNDFSQIKELGILSDYTVIDTKGVSHFVHKCILACHSDFFRAKFLQTRFKKDDSLQWMFLDDKYVLPKILEFFYSGKLEIEDPEKWASFFVCSLQLQSLKLLNMLIEYFKTSLLTQRNVLKVLFTCFEYNETKCEIFNYSIPFSPIKFCVRFLKKKFLAIIHKNKECILSIQPEFFRLLVREIIEVVRSKRKRKYFRAIILKYIVENKMCIPKADILFYIEKINFTPVERLKIALLLDDFPLEPFIEIIIRDFHHISSSELFQHRDQLLPFKTFHSIISKTTLTSDSVVLDEVLSFINANKSKIIAKEIQMLISQIQFQHLDQGDIHRVYENSFVMDKCSELISKKFQEYVSSDDDKERRRRRVVCEKDIELVMVQSGVESRTKAMNALQRCNGDIVDSVIFLTT